MGPGHLLLLQAAQEREENIAWWSKEICVLQSCLEAALKRRGLGLALPAQLLLNMSSICARMTFPLRATL